jgi:hypothetical protein
LTADPDRSALEKGVSSTTLEFKISLLRPISPETGLIKAEGVVLNCGRRVGTAEGRITDHRGRLLAHGAPLAGFLALAAAIQQAIVAISSKPAIHRSGPLRAAS